MNCPSLPRRVAFRPRILALIAATAFTALALPERASAQGGVFRQDEESFYANDGENGLPDDAFGEFGPDLGGFIPFSRFDATQPLVGHVLARRWDAGLSGESFREMVLENFTDLRGLDAKLRKYGRAALLPTPAKAIVLESAPVQRTTWWGKPVTFHPYRIHGGAALVCVPDSSLTSPPDPIHLMLVNMPQHNSDFGVNRNQLLTAYAAPPASWTGPAGAPILSPDEQALDRGDVVVISQENLSESVWIALQRTQEAEYFVREQLLPSLGVHPDPTTSRSFLHGGSWGGIISAFLALMQPKVYSGSAAYSIDDWAYGVGDQRMLLSFHAAATGMLVPDLPNDPFYAPFYALVDLLGTRFDAPQTLASGKTMQPWDLAAFCVNRRESELQVPIQGMLTGEDWIFNCHWSATNSAFNTQFQPQLRRNLEHGGGLGILAGFNEYSIWRGDEWTALIAGANPAAANIPLVPDTPLPHGLPAYPDPYDATLRHVHLPDARETLLTEIDLSSASHAPGSGVRSLGQGAYLAWNDTLFVGDCDGDAGTEVVFGNLDGHVHIMELDATRDPNDPFKLYDEWKSPYLGRELFSLAVTGQGAAARIFAADGLGQIWLIQPAGGSFAVSGGKPFCSPTTAPKFLYPGPTRFLSVGNFAKGHPGDELLAYNRFCDWAMFSAADGSAIQGGRMQRGLHGMGAASAVVADVTGDGDDELLIATQDGIVWAIDPPATGDFSQQVAPGPVAISGPLGLAIYRIVPVDFDKDPGVSHLLLIGRNDARDDDGVHGANVIELFDVRRHVVVGEVETAKSDPLNSVSFAWLKQPNGTSLASFVLSGPTTLQKFTLQRRPRGAGTTSTISLQPSKELEVVHLADAAVRGTQIDALEPFTWNGKAWIVAALGNGRLIVFDDQLGWPRDSSKEFGADPDVTGHSPAQPWYSNRTLARTFACDLVQATPGGDASLYFAEFSLPLLRSPRRYRVGKLDLPATGDATWDPYVTEAPNGAGNPGRVDFNRRLRFADADGDGTREPHVYAEVGDFFVDATSGAVREFCDVAWHPSFFPGNDLTRLFGGHVFAINDLATSDYSYLGGFFVPRDPTQPYADFGGNDWWYPAVGSNRLTGQIANHSQSIFEQTLGAAMKAVELPDPNDATRIAQNIVIGTQGGYVFAIEPGDPKGAAKGAIPSTLSYASTDLGVSVLGLDAGNLDDDPELEVVAGTLLDAGTYGDWVGGDKSRNRGHLVILDPQPSVGPGPGSFGVTQLDGDDFAGVGAGIGSGVTGVKVDDVDGDGVNEIWCGDAVGHLWLFRRVAGAWECRFRSADLAAYPGIYNNLFPVKDANGHTVKLVVVSAGYVMAFAVDWQQLLGS